MKTPTVEFCPAIREYVDIDQTQLQCAATYGCIKEVKCCPLDLCFFESENFNPFYTQPETNHKRYRHN